MIQKTINKKTTVYNNNESKSQTNIRYICQHTCTTKSDAALGAKNWMSFTDLQPVKRSATKEAGEVSEKKHKKHTQVHKATKNKETSV